MPKAVKIAWRDEPEKDDYDAAERYLRLILEVKEARNAVRALRKAPLEHYIVRDILRAAGLSLLGISDSDEKKQELLAGGKVSPLLLLRSRRCEHVIIADGYHRLCTMYRIDERASVPCKLV